MITKMDIGQIKHLTSDEWERLGNTSLGAQMIKNGIRFNRTFPKTKEEEEEKIRCPNELKDWVKENTRGLYYLVSYTSQSGTDNAYFELEKDAMAFKLRWM